MKYRMVSGPESHVFSSVFNWCAFFALTFLTIVTVLLSHIDLGFFNIIIMLTVAALKALIVLSIFMELIFDNKFFTVILAIPLFFFILFVGFCVLDYASLGDVNEGGSCFVSKSKLE